MLVACLPRPETRPNPLRQMRLAYIDSCLAHYGWVSRAALAAAFGVSQAQATRDLRQYNAEAPGNMVLLDGGKRWTATPDFSPVYH